ncbi:hypothetical protein I302_108721 [Kwoniella bestiolae CBS 10118]|uniref:Uncharacterized protein n=1 Tax=Kwoniella bestiolae CBS 10118 TaxID=1296100 RepID=A0A1B9FTX2_9TREE|nr:hypothetical protein I302_07858 [Kwoniella bestiolae CBS 10118]OCF22213.1 hypothetical protein I302_07858 [Kwoniella bestiolae CBS 10118]
MADLHNVVKRKDDDNPFGDGLPLPALIAIPIFSVFFFCVFSFIIYSCIRNRRLKRAFNKQSTIPKIDLNRPPDRGFNIDEHVVTPYPMNSSSTSEQPIFPAVESHHLSLQPSIDSHAIPIAQPTHSRTPSQEALLRRGEEDEGDVLPPSYAQLSGVDLTRLEQNR